MVVGLATGWDGRSDIYSLGALLYELLVLDPPFPGKNAWDVLDNIQNVVPLPPSQSERAGDLSPELDSIIMKCLEKKKDGRYQTVRTLKNEIELFLSGRPIGAMEYSPWQVFSKWIVRNKTLSLSSMAISPDGRLLASGDDGSTIKIWDIARVT